MNDDELLRRPFGTRAAEFREFCQWFLDNKDDLEDYLTDDEVPISERDQFAADLRQLVAFIRRVEQFQRQTMQQAMHPEQS